MAVWTWSWYNGATQTDFGANNVDKIAFFGWDTDVATSYNKKIVVNAYNATMHLRKIADNADDCASPHMTGVKYVAAATCNINNAGTVNVSTLANNDCIKILFADAGMSFTENSYIYCYGATTADAPTGITAYVIEKDDAAWTAVAGSGTKKTLTNPSGASVAWYVAMSVSPTSVGAKNTEFTWRIETDYF